MKEGASRALFHLLFPSQYGKLLCLGRNLLVPVEDSDAEHCLSVFQAIVSLDGGRVADAFSCGNTFHHDILRHMDVLVTCYLGDRGQNTVDRLCRVIVDLEDQTGFLATHQRTVAAGIHKASIANLQWIRTELRSGGIHVLNSREVLTKTVETVVAAIAGVKSVIAIDIVGVAVAPSCTLARGLIVLITLLLCLIGSRTHGCSYCSATCHSYQRTDVTSTVPTSNTTYCGPDD